MIRFVCRLAIFATFWAMPATAADEASRYRDGAMRGDYQSQRNYAFILANGDGVPQNMTEACMWRLVIISSQHAKVIETDIANLDITCKSPSVVEAAGQRGKALLAKLPVRERTVETDLSDITEATCPGKSCSQQYGSLESDYRRAVAGETQAMRRLAQCFSTRCDPAYPFDLFRACIWARSTLVSLGDSASKDDKVRENNTCGILSDRARGLADIQIKRIGEMASRPAKRR